MPPDPGPDPDYFPANQYNAPPLHACPYSFTIILHFPMVQWSKQVVLA